MDCALVEDLCWLLLSIPSLLLPSSALLITALRRNYAELHKINETLLSVQILTIIPHLSFSIPFLHFHHQIIIR